MAFIPAIPATGLTGLRFLDQTMDRQQETFNKSVDVQREIDLFRAGADDIKSLDDLMGDRRTLQVVLGAFGLEDDIDKRAFIRKVIEEGTTESDAFANRLADPAYKKLAAAVGFGDFDGGWLQFNSAQETIVTNYKARQFEKAVGEIDLDLRLALNFRREVPELLAEGGADKTIWFKLVGSDPLREVVQTAFNLPTQFGQIDLDRQAEVLAERAEQFLGDASPSALADPAVLDKMVERFMLNRQVANGAFGASTPGATALSLLQSAGIGTAAQTSLFTSQFL